MVGSGFLNFQQGNLVSGNFPYYRIQNAICNNNRVTYLHKIWQRKYADDYPGPFSSFFCIFASMTFSNE